MGVSQPSYLPDQPSTSASFASPPLAIKQEPPSDIDTKPLMYPFTVHSNCQVQQENSVIKTEIKEESPTQQQQNCLSAAQQNTASVSKNNFFRPFQTSPQSSTSTATQNIPAQITSTLSPRPLLDSSAAATTTDSYPPSDQSSVPVHPLSFYTPTTKAIHSSGPWLQQSLVADKEQQPQDLRRTFKAEPADSEQSQTASLNAACNQVSTATSYSTMYKTEEQQLIPQFPPQLSQAQLQSRQSPPQAASR